ncbi:prepro-urotensin II-beta [Chanos chanos]|uniref:Prepro-urotensin II-beta n=1 Tax=Chanos chanos TaxID=29144 RepID=A0A6J2VNR8_CHACN|nr:prepro-urotensin II-beta-like [Chanos chanos]
MICKLLLSCALLLTAAEPLLAHPLTHSSERTYAGPVSVEEDQIISPDEFSLSDQEYLSKGSAGYGYPSILTGDIRGEGLRTPAILSSQPVKEVILKKPLLNPLSHYLGSRKQYRKRGSTTECFWKYCV